MKLATKYGLVGIGALAALSLAHWLRRSGYGGGGIWVYILGVVPNLVAAVAIPFVALSAWADQNQGASYAAIRRCFVVVALVSAVGLVAWEFLQLTGRLVFDAHDLGATIVGLGVGWLLFWLVTPAGDQAP